MASAEGAPLEQFCLLAKHARDRAAVELIKQVLSHKKCFVFGELLAMPNMQALHDSAEHGAYLRLLELFAYGTYNDYQAQRESLPELNEQQTEKLRQLSIVSLAHRSKQVPYALLTQELNIHNIRELEDLIIDTIYAGLITGKLNQAQGLLRVQTAVPRDVRPEDVDMMIEKLLGWHGNVERILTTMERCVAESTTARDEHTARKTELQQEVEEVKKTLKDRGPSAVGTGPSGRFDAMDVDRFSKRAASRGKRSRGPFGDVRSKHSSFAP